MISDFIWNDNMMPVVVNEMRECSPVIIMHDNYTLISNAEATPWRASRVEFTDD
ncbi:MAG: hypothetical protein GWO26_29840 [Phycisphaerae bacterium]|nr:hypothetical protein [Phycisphaerae bacterium]